MASVGLPPTSSCREPNGHFVGADTLPDEMNDMKIRDDKVHIYLQLSNSVFIFIVLTLFFVDILFLIFLF